VSPPAIHLRRPLKKAIHSVTCWGIRQRSKAFLPISELRDLSLYETLLDSSFIFVWHDFDAQVDREWGFAQDLETTRRLFQNSSLIRLQWNQIITQDELERVIKMRIVRSFNLTVTLEQGDVFRTDGNVNFQLVRPDSVSSWRLRRWRDESEL
jgi:hypothetical protein